MPIYEYRCLNCRRRFDRFMTYSEYESALVACSHCDSTNISRKIGKIRIARSDETRMDSLSDFEGMENLDADPRALGQMMRRMKSEVGEEMPAEFDEVVNRLESGQSPEDIENDLPELGNAGEDSSGGFGGNDLDY